jgi:putative transposase
VALPNTSNDALEPDCLLGRLTFPTRFKQRTYRLYSEERLQVRTKCRKKLVRPRVAMPVPMRINVRWSMDFVSDQLANGRRFRVLNVVDDFSRECVGQLTEISIGGRQVARFLERLVQRGKPATLVSDNGTEFTSKAMFFWAKENGVVLHFIQPGKPPQNAFVESFNARFRNGCLNQHWFRDLIDAREEIDRWRQHYNEVRPHGSLGYVPLTCLISSSHSKLGNGSSVFNFFCLSSKR